MAAGKKLSDFEKGQITCFLRNNFNLSEIARLLKRSRRVISNYAKSPETYGTKRSSGRPCSLSPREKRKVWKIASNSDASLSTIRALANLSVSKATILRTIHDCTHLVRRKMNTAPCLKKEHKEKRMKFARENMDRNWKTVS